jgi:hypothetical protein
MNLSFPSAIMDHSAHGRASTYKRKPQWNTEKSGYKFMARAGLKRMTLEKNTIFFSIW